MYHKMTKLSKSLSNVFKNLKKSSDGLNFPSGKEYEQLLSQDADKTDPSVLENFKQLQENEKKYEFMTGEGEHEESPVRILDTRMMGSPNRLRALIEDDSGKRNIVQIHRLKNVKLTGQSLK